MWREMGRCMIHETWKKQKWRGASIKSKTTKEISGYQKGTYHKSKTNLRKEIMATQVDRKGQKKDTQKEEGQEKKTK